MRSSEEILMQVKSMLAIENAMLNDALSCQKYGKAGESKAVIAVLEVLSDFINSRNPGEVLDENRRKSSGADV